MSTEQCNGSRHPLKRFLPAAHRVCIHGPSDAFMTGMQEATEDPVEDSGQEVCSTREAAERLRVSLRTVQLWSESGVLLAWKTPGGHRRILQSSVEDLLRKRGAELARGAASGRYRVLIVEDEPDFRRLFELHLESWGLPIELESVSCGFDALLRIGAARPDLLITDLRMPGIDGFEMIRSLQASDVIGDLDIIVVTALTERTIAERGGLPDRITVMHKPLRFEQLRHRIQQLIKDRQQQAAAG